MKLSNGVWINLATALFVIHKMIGGHLKIVDGAALVVNYSLSLTTKKMLRSLS